MQQEGAPDAKQAESGLTGTLDRSMAGELMPAINVTAPDGTTLNLAALQGRPVLVNLWATWCAPCVTEMPMLDELAARYDGTLRVVTISQDLQGAEKVVPFFEKGKYTHLEPWLDPETQLSFAYGGGVLPTTVLYDAQGQEVWRMVGGYDWSGEDAAALVDEVVSAQ
ncbi:MAG: TlpA family protein disulfide reductase [Sphingomonadaceae bacterium]|nr:TlpA family protein disulfide reductase [Sphingomonadaceae bacterium]